MNPYFTAFLLLALLSTLWSIDSGATVARWVTLFSIVIVCFAFGLASWHARRFQAVVRPVLTLLMLGSLIFGLISPDLAIDMNEGSLKGSWHGLMIQKNQFGQLASFGVIMWLHAYLSKQSKMPYVLVFGALSVACLLLSRSQTSLLATIFSSVLILMMLRMPAGLRRYVPYLVAIFATVVVIYAVAVLKLVPGLDMILAPITSFTGKGHDLLESQRDLADREGKCRLASPSRVGLFRLLDRALPPVALGDLSIAHVFYPSQSHNGYLEVMNDLGFVGLFVLLGYLGMHVRQSLQLMRVDRAQAALIPQPVLSAIDHQSVGGPPGSPPPARSRPPS